MSPDADQTPDAGFGVAMAERVRPRSRTIARRTVGAAPGRLAGRMVDFASAMGVAPLARLEMEQGTLAAPGGASVRPPLDPWLWGPEDEPVETHAATPWQPARSTVRRAPRRGLPLTTRRQNRTVGGAGTAPGAIARRLAPGADTAPADPIELIARARGRAAADRRAPVPAATRARPAVPAPAEPAGGLPSDLERLRRMLIRDGKLSAPTPGEMPPPPGRPDLRPSAAPGAGSAPADLTPNATTATAERVSVAGSIDRATVANARRAREDAGTVRRSPQDPAVGTAPAATPDGRPGPAIGDAAPRPPSMWLGEVDTPGGLAPPASSVPSMSSMSSAPPASARSVDPAALASVINRRAARPEPARRAPVQFAPGTSGGAAPVTGTERTRATPTGPSTPEGRASLDAASVIRRSPVADVIAQRRPATAGPVGVLDPHDDVPTDAGRLDTARTAALRTEPVRTETPDVRTAPTDAVHTNDVTEATDATTGAWTVAPPPLAPAERQPSAPAPARSEPAPARRPSNPVVRRLAEVAPSIAEVRAAPDRPDTAPGPDARTAPHRPDTAPVVAPSHAGDRVAADRPDTAPAPTQGRAADRPTVSPSEVTVPASIDRSGAAGLRERGDVHVDAVPAASVPGIPIEDLPVRPAVAPPAADDAVVRREADVARPAPQQPGTSDRRQQAAVAREDRATVTAADLRRIAARPDRPVPLTRDAAAAAIARAPGRRIAPADLSAPARRESTVAPGALPLAVRPDPLVDRAAIGGPPGVAAPDGFVATPAARQPANPAFANPAVPAPAFTDPASVDRASVSRAAATPTAGLPVRMPAPGGPPTSAGDAGRVTRGVLRRTVADMPLRRRHEPLAAAVVGAAAQQDAGVMEQLAGDEDRGAPIAERFMSELSRRRAPRPTPLPDRLRPMSELITGGVIARVATDRISRQALRSVGKVAATVGDTIHLDRPVHQVRTEVLAHELTHVAHPSPAPRFFDDDRPSIEERRADAIGKLMRSTAPSVIRRTPAHDAPTGTGSTGTGSTGTVSAAALADQLTSGGGGNVIRRWKTATPSGRGQSPSIGGARAQAAAPQPVQQDAPAPPPPAPAPVVEQPAAVAAPTLAEQFDDLLDMLEERVLREIERRGGRIWGGM